MSAELNNIIWNLQGTLSKKTTFNITKLTMMGNQENGENKNVLELAIKYINILS